MHIVFFVHPDFLGSQSMPRYAAMLSKGMAERKHSISVWTAKPFFYKLPCPGSLKKWLGYIDQFVIFPFQVRKRLHGCASQTLFVFTDQALGPWMPLISKRPHVVHCHDFLAQRSALGEIAENRIGLSGKIYQRMIRNGYSKSKNFISISQKTQSDLHRLLKSVPGLSKVVYNGLNEDFGPGSPVEARRSLQKEFGIGLTGGYILHVGGNQFYKNRKGVVEIYCSWRKISNQSLPLILIGPPPAQELKAIAEQSKHATNIHFFSNVSSETLKMAYQGAQAFVFPSLEEGFGWPIAEAMASGCPVITTGRAPMNEVGEQSCYYIDRKPVNPKEVGLWAKKSALVLEKLLNLSEDERQKLVGSGILNARRFDTQKALGDIEACYKEVLKTYEL